MFCVVSPMATENFSIPIYQKIIKKKIHKHFIIKDIFGMFAKAPSAVFPWNR
jgi:hypothetical protein